MKGSDQFLLSLFIAGNILIDKFFPVEIRKIVMTTKRFAFKSSKLSSAADQLWSASKSGFKADEKNIKLDLGKMLTKDKPAKSESTEAAKTTADGFIFGSKLSEKVIVSNGVCIFSFLLLLSANLCYSLYCL